MSRKLYKNRDKQKNKLVEKNMLVVLMSVHIIGAAIAIYIHCRNETMEQASKYGDGIRWAKPSDVIFQDCLLWKVQLIIYMMGFIEDSINSQFSKYFQ